MNKEHERVMLDACTSTLSETIADIQAAIRIPGVSKTGQSLEPMADMVRAALDGICDEVRVHPGQIAPIIEGVARSDGAKGRLLFYTLYDVQPADEPGWTHPPFAAEVETGADGKTRLIGRGAFNSKGPLFGFLSVVREFRRRSIPLPVDIHFVIEGEEEIGSPSLGGFVRDNAARLRSCDATLIPYLGSDADGQNILRLGFNGLGFIELSVRGGEWGGPMRQTVHALHNGWLASPAWELVRALASLRDENGDFRCDGLRSDWWGAEQQQMADEAARLLDAGAILDGLGAERFSRDAPLAEQLRRLLGQPTLNIDALVAGDVPKLGQPATTIPQEARAWLDMRFTPGMDPQAAVNALRQHLDKRGFEHVRMDVRSTYPASLSHRGEPAVAAMEQACRAHCDRFVVLPLHAGAAPLYVFSEILQVPYVFGGLGHGGKSHAPNEFLEVESMGDFMRSMVTFLFKFAEKLA